MWILIHVMQFYAMVGTHLTTIEAQPENLEVCGVKLSASIADLESYRGLPPAFSYLFLVDLPSMAVEEKARIFSCQVGCSFRVSQVQAPAPCYPRRSLGTQWLRSFLPLAGGSHSLHKVPRYLILVLVCSTGGVALFVHLFWLNFAILTVKNTAASLSSAAFTFCLVKSKLIRHDRRFLCQIRQEICMLKTQKMLSLLIGIGMSMTPNNGPADQRNNCSLFPILLMDLCKITKICLLTVKGPFIRT